MLDALPKRLRIWWPMVAVAAETAALDPCILLGVLDRESLGGVALRPRSCNGTGDWTPRHWSRYADEPDAEQRYKHWRPTADEYIRQTHKKVNPLWEVVPEICVPIDGLGFGRGLMQLDYADPSNRAFLDKRMDGGFAWQNAHENINFGARKLGALLFQFQGEDFLACAAYNAGPAAVNRALRALSSPATTDRRREAVDAVTTGRNYASDVIERARHFRALLGMNDAEGETT